MTAPVEITIAGQTVSRETVSALEAYAELVKHWNPAINLVSKATLPDLWGRHISDSAQLLELCPPGARKWADLGAGGGFPGLVIAILAREKYPELRVVLVESDQRKATFLRQATRKLGLDVAVLDRRIEEIPPLGADVVSARALAPLTTLLEYANRHLHPDGIAIFPKGSRHAEELSVAAKSWEFAVDSRPSVSEPDAAILLIRKIHRARQN